MITIRISGAVGNGKSTLGIFLRRMLILLGAKVIYKELKYSSKGDIQQELAFSMNHLLFAEDKELSFKNKEILIEVE